MVVMLIGSGVECGLNAHNNSCQGIASFFIALFSAAGAGGTGKSQNPETEGGGGMRNRPPDGRAKPQRI